MDPFTHGVVGLGLVALAGHPVTADGLDVVSVAALAGALLPDGDIIWQLRGDLAYLKRHRAESHSLLVALIGAAVVAGVLSLFFPGAPEFPGLFCWTFAGWVSHLVLDIGNSYGARIFWPFCRQRVTVNWLPLCDPMLIGLFLLPQWLVGPGWFALAGIYVLWRFWGHHQAVRWVVKEYARPENHQPAGGFLRVLVLPARSGCRCWDFLAENEQVFWVGRVVLGRRTQVQVVRRLPKQPDDPLIKAALVSPLGRFFVAFTPHCYITKEERANAAIVRFFDLRYLVRGEFLHRATAVFEGNVLKRAVFQPYNPHRQVRVS